MMIDEFFEFILILLFWFLLGIICIALVHIIFVEIPTSSEFLKESKAVCESLGYSYDSSTYKTFCIDTSTGLVYDLEVLRNK